MGVYRQAVVWLLRIAGWAGLIATIIEIVQSPQGSSISYSLNSLGAPLMLMGFAELVAVALRWDRLQEKRT